MDNNRTEGYLLAKDVAAMFGVTMRTVYKWIELGKLHPVKPGRRHLFVPADVARFETEWREQRKRNWGGKREKKKAE